MRMFVVGAVILATALAVPAPSAAQGAYAGASLTGDFVRFDRVDVGGSSGTAGGEALGFALRLGTPIGRVWGVELELARPEMIESDETPDFLPLVAAGIGGGVTTGVSVPPGVSLPPAVDLTTPRVPVQVFSYRVHTARRYTTLSASVWAAQEVSRRVSLVYLGGIGFHRSTFASETTFERFAALPFVIVPQPFSVETLTYSVRPVAGFEARIGLTDHAQLVPGIRMHGVSGGWLIRPAVGLAWQF